MIRYALECKKGHRFEAWFQSSAAYDDQAKTGKVTCAVCGSKKVAKSLMAPNVATRETTAVPVAQTPADEGQDAMRRELVSLMRKIRTEVEKNAEYVGPQFAEEARKIHYEEAPARGIYGEASADDVQSLREEGVAFYPLPKLPEEQN
jgi:hypothetical protein